MTDNIKSVRVKVVEDDPKGITINVSNDGNCESPTPVNEPAEVEASVSNHSSPPSEPTETTRRNKNRNSMKYRNTGQWRDVIAKAWQENAESESFAGMTLEEFKSVTQNTIAERETLEKLRRDVSGTIVRRKVADKETRSKNKRVVYAILASPKFGADSDLYRSLGYVTDIERANGLKREGGDSAPETDQ